MLLSNHNSVVMTVFRSGILDLSCLITLSWTSHGQISSKLVLALLAVPDFIELDRLRDSDFVVAAGASNVLGENPFTPVFRVDNWLVVVR